MAVSYDSLAPRRRTESEGRSLYSQLLELIRSDGLLKFSPRYYIVLLSVNAALLVGTCVAFVMLADTWWQLLTAALLGVIFTQLGFIGHDCGHRQISKSRVVNYVIGILCADLVIGFSFGWWVDKHRRHHAYPNHEELDPDIGSKVIAFFPAAAAGRRGLSRTACRYQAAIMSAALPFQSMAMRIGSLRFLRKTFSPRRKLECVVLLFNTTVYLTSVCVILTPLRALAFIAVHQGVVGAYLGLSFAPNHKGMPITNDHLEMDFLRRQVVPSRNIRGGPLVDIMLGGVNYQIEHHLFPSMPRPSLRKAAPIVREFCRVHEVSYIEATLIDSYRLAFTYLNNVWRSAD